MAERKGLFGRLFGRKSKEDEAEKDDLADPAATTTPARADEAEPESGTAAESEAAPEDDDDTPVYSERSEAEETADLDAAQSTAPEDGEPVVFVTHDEEDDDEESLDPVEESLLDDEEEEDALEQRRRDEAAGRLAPEPKPKVTEDEPATAPAEVDEEPLATEPPVTEEPSLPDEEPETAAAPLVDEPTPEEEQPKKRGLFGRLKDGLAKTSSKLTGGIGAIFTKRKLDDETLEELEDLLITADLGLPATTRIITTLSKSKYDQEISDEEVRAILSEEITRTLKPLEAPLEIDPSHRPHVILMTGVNGAGKTTTIGKLARKFTDEGHKVLLAAGDTFRAAAIEQLTVWGERVGVPVVAKETGADAAGLAFDAIKKAQDENIDVVLIDTAGRLQNRKELMEELAKIVRVIRKLVPDAPHDTVLVLDATVGQNALSQAEAFLQTADVSGLVMTKLDGTARGGVLVALGDKFELPIHFIGVGEAVEDLQSFDADEFARALTAPGE